MVDEEGGHPGLGGAQQAFPGLEALLTVPFSFIAKYTHNKKYVAGAEDGKFDACRVHIHHI
jgi:hypothetical protein